MPLLESRPGTKRFLKSFGVGVCTFSFDLLLLSIFIDVFHIYYLVSAVLAFIIAVSVNYFISRRYVFKGTERSVHTGYALFLLIGSVGAFFVGSFMYICVDILGLHYLVSRLLTATVVGWWNYFMNLYVNFKVAGNHEE